MMGLRNDSRAEEEYHAVQSTISQSSPLTMTQEVVRIGGAGVGTVVGRQSIRTSSSDIS